MAGSSNITGDESIIFADNASFDGTERGGKLTTNGQLWIGSTVSPHVRVGSLTSLGGTITITKGNGTIDLAGAVVAAQTLTPDTGGVVTAVANNINVLGYDTGAISLVDTHNTAAGTLKIETRSWLTPFVVDPSTTVGTRGTFSTIAAALTAAVSGQTIFIRAGSYTENLTLKAGVNITAFTGDDNQSNVIITGKATASFSGVCSISNVELITNSDFVLSLTGANSTAVILRNCFLNATNNSLLNSSGSDATSGITMLNCGGNLATTGIKIINSSNGLHTWYVTTFINSGGSTTASTISAGTLFLRECQIGAPMTTSGTGVLANDYTVFDTSTQNATCLTIGGGSSQSFHCRYSSGSASAISISATLTSSADTITSSNAATIAGAGTLVYNAIAFYSVGTTSAATTTTQTALKLGPLVNVGALAANYVATAISYQILRSDYTIGVTNTAAARTITTPATGATTGQIWIIKDESGGAAAFPIIVAAGTGTIDGAASVTIPTNYGAMTVYFNGTNYFVV